MHQSAVVTHFIVRSKKPPKAEFPVNVSAFRSPAPATGTRAAKIFKRLLSRQPSATKSVAGTLLWAIVRRRQQRRCRSSLILELFPFCQAAVRDYQRGDLNDFSVGCDGEELPPSPPPLPPNERTPKGNLRKPFRQDMSFASDSTNDDRPKRGRGGGVPPGRVRSSGGDRRSLRCTPIAQSLSFRRVLHSACLSGSCGAAAGVVDCILSTADEDPSPVSAWQRKRLDFGYNRLSELPDLEQSSLGVQHICATIGAAKAGDWPDDASSLCAAAARTEDGRKACQLSLGIPYSYRDFVLRLRRCSSNPVHQPAGVRVSIHRCTNALARRRDTASAQRGQGRRLPADNVPVVNTRSILIRRAVRNFPVPYTTTPQLPAIPCLQARPRYHFQVASMQASQQLFRPCFS
ncbi:hypothetical protein MTO96_024437 [Rhipicephalus appendiculatus]